DPLGVDPAEGLHVGDQPRSDVAGALATGMRAALLDRYGRHDPAAVGVPVVRDLGELVDFVLGKGEMDRGTESALRAEGGAVRRLPTPTTRLFVSTPLIPRPHSSAGRKAARGTR